MIPKLFLVLFTLLLSTLLPVYSAQAKTRVLVNLQELGLFGNALHEIVETSKARGYELVVLSHYTQEEIAAVVPSFPGNGTLIQCASKDEFQAAIKTEALYASKGKDTQGLFINLSHGKPKETGERSHRTLVGKEWISLDEIIPLQQAYGKGGGLFAIQDGSCFSGDIIDLGNEHTCVISSQDSLRMASGSNCTNGTFVESYWKAVRNHFKEGSDLTIEEAFLKSRLYVNDSTWNEDSPQISTPAGKKIKQFIETVYFSYNDLKREKGGEDRSACFQKELPSLTSAIVNMSQFLNDILSKQLKDITSELKKLENLRKINTAKRQMKNPNPENENLWEEFDSIREQEKSKLNELAKIEKSLYQALYESLRSTSKEPCDRFKF